MRVAFLGWANPALGAAEGGGCNIVAAEHLAALAKAGHQVLYLRSGVDYSLSYALRRRNIQSRPTSRITFRRYYRGVQCYSLVNSAVRAPGLFQMPRHNDVDHRPQVDLVCGWLAQLSVEHVWVHSLEGQPILLLRELAGHGFRVSVFCHDHFYLCPRISLLYSGKEPCLDYNHGYRCTGCLPTGFAQNYEIRAALTAHTGFWGGLFRRLFGWYDARRAALRSDGLAGPEPGSLPEQPPSNERFFSSLNMKHQPATFAAQRRAAAISALNSVEKVYCPSQFVATSLMRSGVAGERIQRVRIGLPHLDVIQKRRAQLQGRARAARPVTFAYHGTAAYHKGLAVLLDAIRLLDERTKTTARFLVRGVSRSDLGGSPENVQLFPCYSTAELPEFIQTYDVGVSPHLWFENSPLTVLEHLAAGKPVIASRLGGVTDVIREGETGWLFDAGAADQLATVIEQIARGERKIPYIAAKEVESFESFIRTLGS